LTEKMQDEYLAKLNDMQAKFDAKADPSGKDCIELAELLMEASLICRSKQTEMMKECEEMISRAKDKDPNDIKLGLLISRRARDSGRPQRGIVALERCIEAHGDTLDMSDRLVSQLELAIAKREVGLPAQAKPHLDELRRIMPKDMPAIARLEVDLEECLNTAWQAGPWEPQAFGVIDKCGAEFAAWKKQAKPSVRDDPRQLVHKLLSCLVQSPVKLDAAVAKAHSFEAFKDIAEECQSKRKQLDQQKAEALAKTQKRQFVMAIVAFCLVFAYVFVKFVAPDHSGKKRGGRSEF